jgi:hypothetical protein
MKPRTLTTGRLLLVLLTVGLTIGLVSWDHQQSPDRYRQSINDTTPKKKSVDREKKIRDLDDVLDELNGVDLKMDMEKMQKELNESMKNLDMKKMQLDIEKSMRDVDFQKIQKEMEQSMAKIDFGNIEKEMAKAMKEFDAAKIQKEVQESMEKIDMKKMQIDMEKMQNELSKMGPEIVRSLENAKVGIEKAKVEMKEYKEFVDGLEKDGLINKKEEYTIKHDKGELFINGKKASDATYKKYKSFLDKRKKFTIEKSDDDFNIDID